MSAVLLTASPAVDPADSACDETDAPIVVSLPSLPQLRLTSLVPLTKKGAQPTLLDVREPNHFVSNLKSSQQVRGSDNLRPLLCSFLI
jgi:hypothetical protein